MLESSGNPDSSGISDYCISRGERSEQGHTKKNEIGKTREGIKTYLVTGGAGFIGSNFVWPKDAG